MRKHFTLLLTALLLISVATFASGRDKKRNPETTAKIVKFDETTAAATASTIEKNGFVQSTESTFNGTPTGLSGFWDYQVNGGAVKYIAVNPTDPNKIHVTYMLSTDPANASVTRRVGYAYSSNGGVTWNAISSVSGIREGFPSLTLLNTGTEHLGVVACHNQPTGQRLLSRAYIDVSEGGLSFTGFAPDDPGTTLGGNLIWPYITAKPDGSKMYMMSSFSGGPETVHMVEFDAALGQFGTHGPALATEDGDILTPGGRYNVVVSPSGNKVTMYHLRVGGPAENYISFSESTDGGATFPAFKRLTKLTPSGPGIGVITTLSDSIAPWIACDAVYRGENLTFVFSTGRYVGPGYQFRGQGIWFCSQATGFVNVVDTNKIQAIFPGWEGYIRPGGALNQVNHFPIDYPSIGVTPNGDLHCVFAVARRDTSAEGRNFYTVAYTKSTNGGASWSNPVLLEDDPTQDFRYPSIAEFNPDNNFVNIVYQQDPVPGSSAFSDNAPISSAQLLFQRLAIPSAQATQIVSTSAVFSFPPTGVSISFTGVSGTGTCTVQRFDAPPSNLSFSGTPPTFTSQYRFVITASGFTFTSAELRFNRTQIPNAGITNAGTVSVYRRPTPGTGAFSILPNTFNASFPDEVRATTTAFSEFILGSDDNQLPVELVAFTARNTAEGVQLAWRTASEQNNAGFEVQRRSEKASEWQVLGFVRGAGTTAEAQSYTFLDKSASGKVQYRLKQIDFDGQFEYSNIIEVDAGAPKQFALEQNYPNPFNPTTLISYQLPVASEVSLKVYDVLGKEIATLVNERQEAGTYHFNFNASSLSSGVYFYRIKAGNFVSTKKMMLVK